MQAYYTNIRIHPNTSNSENHIFQLSSYHSTGMHRSRHIHLIRSLIYFTYLLPDSFWSCTGCHKFHILLKFKHATVEVSILMTDSLYQFSIQASLIMDSTTHIRISCMQSYSTNLSTLRSDRGPSYRQVNDNYIHESYDLIRVFYYNQQQPQLKKKAKTISTSYQIPDLTKIYSQTQQYQSECHLHRP